MTTVTRRQRRGKKGRKALFFDQTFDGYIRDMALEKYHEILDVAEVNQISLIEAAESAGHFPERVPHHKVWRQGWLEHVQNDLALSMDDLLERVEKGIRAGLEAERGLRIEEGQKTIEDTLHYKAFADKAMENLLREANGEMEDDF